MISLVTGSAGFIGSHLVKKLEQPVIIDKVWGTDLVVDLLRINDNVDTVYHLAANSDVRNNNPHTNFHDNIMATRNLLECIRKSKVKTLVFTSSSTVYGEATQIPTPETYGPLIPISHYGASKLACEALICSYASTYGFNARIYRLANVVGGQAKHGVIYDFVRKLKKDPNYLEILGNGLQSKSYIHIDDCISALLIPSNKNIDILNVGNNDTISVFHIGHIIMDEMNIDYTTIATESQKRGWQGDITEMYLDISKLKSLGWKPKYSTSKAAVQAAVREMLALDNV